MLYTMLYVMLYTMMYTIFYMFDIVYVCVCVASVLAIGSELFKIAQGGAEDAIHLVTTMADDFFSGQYFTTKSCNAGGVKQLRTVIFGLGTTHLTFIVHNWADRGGASRGVIVFLFETNTK